jgi:hypothetical protein
MLEQFSQDLCGSSVALAVTFVPGEWHSLTSRNIIDRYWFRARHLHFGDSVEG